MDVINKLTDIDVAAFDQLLLAIRRIESEDGQVSVGDARNLRVIAQNLIQAKLDGLQVLERYEQFVVKREDETQEYCKKLEKVVQDLKDSAETQNGNEALLRKVSNLQEQLDLKNEECEYLRGSNAELQNTSKAETSSSGISARALEEKSEEVLRLQDELKQLKLSHSKEIQNLVEQKKVEAGEESRKEVEAIRRDYEEQIGDLVQEGEQMKLEIDKLKLDYEGQIDELVQEGQEAELAEDREREVLEGQLAERDEAIKKLEEETKFLKADSEVKGNLVEKLRKENEDLSTKYTKQTSKTRELTEELTTAHDQRQSEKEMLLEEIRALKGRVSKYSTRVSELESRGSGAGPETTAALDTEEPPPIPIELKERVGMHGNNANGVGIDAGESSTSALGAGIDDDAEVLQEKLKESNPSARLLAPLSPNEKEYRSPFHAAMGEVLERSTSINLAASEADSEEYVEIFWDGRWWKARVKERNEETKRMSLVFGPQGNELIQWVPFKSLRVRPFTDAAKAEESKSDEENEDESQLEHSISMDEFFMSRISEDNEEEEEEGGGFQTRGVQGGAEPKKKKKRFKALRRLTSIGRPKQAPNPSVQSKRNRFMSMA